ncbi:MAG: Do family serine endopeptidase [Panacagrimonas sp.]
MGAAASLPRLVGGLLLTVFWLAGCSPTPGGSAPDFAALVAEVSPSVVNISALSQDLVREQRSVSDELQDTPEWFRRFLEENGAAEDDGAPSQPQSLGSGLVLWEDGYILTNFHVIRDAREIVVRLLDRRQLTATVIGSDERSDLALLKIDAKGLPAVRLADPEELRPGQWVLAIGSPFGFDYSVTAGIISAMGRSLPSEQYVPFIQTDVAINPGNSGGPLFNMKGEVVGVNSQIYSQSGGYQGLSFAVPADVAFKVAKQLRDNGRVQRGWLGVVVREVDREIAAKVGLDKPEGALITRVVENSPAQEAGLREGDVILSFNDQSLAHSGGLPPLVGAVDPGDLIDLELFRDGRRVMFKVEIGMLKNQDVEVSRQAGEIPPSAPALIDGALGMVVSSLGQKQRRDLQVLSGGVVVIEVRGESVSAAGIRPGDVILSIAGQEVDSPERLAEVFSRLTPGSSVPVLVSRNGNPSFRPLQVPEVPNP